MKITSSQNRVRLGVPYLDLISNKSSTYSVASICLKMVKSSTISCVETSTGLSCKMLTLASFTWNKYK